MEDSSSTTAQPASETVVSGESSQTDSTTVTSQPAPDDGSYMNVPIDPNVTPSQPAVEAPFEMIRLTDILGVFEVAQQRERDDNAIVQRIANPDMVDIRNRLVQWGGAGFVGYCTLFEIAIQPPERCSDGQARSLYDYIVFVSGKTIYEHMEVLQRRLPDFVVSFLYLPGSIVQFRVSRA